jgi:hypothetical protein
MNGATLDRLTASEARDWFSDFEIRIISGDDVATTRGEVLRR